MAHASLHQGEGLAHMAEAGLSAKALYLRELRRQRAAAEGREVREYIKRGTKAESPADWRREHKNKLRAEKAATKPPKHGRYALHNNHVSAWQRQMRIPHDAHVRLFKADAARIERWKVRQQPGYRLNMRLRVAIRKALKGAKQGRSWESFVGYTLAELVAHLQRQLPKHTTLKEALEAGWHIDHITPKSTFDLANLDELRKAWGLANLRLIPADENMRKGARREFLL